MIKSISGGKVDRGWTDFRRRICRSMILSAAEAHVQYLVQTKEKRISAVRARCCRMIKISAIVPRQCYKIVTLRV